MLTNLVTSVVNLSDVTPRTLRDDVTPPGAPRAALLRHNARPYKAFNAGSRQHNKRGCSQERTRRCLSIIGGSQWGEIRSLGIKSLPTERGLFYPN